MLAAWQITKNNNLQSLNIETEYSEEYDTSSFPILDESITVSNSKIVEECGEELNSDWYKNGDENSGFNVVKKSDGTVNTEQGYQKRNSKGKNAENYPNCKSQVVLKSKRVN